MEPVRERRQLGRARRRRTERDTVREPQPRHRVDDRRPAWRQAVLPNLEVEVAPDRVPSISHRADDLACCHRITLFERRLVAVEMVIAVVGTDPITQNARKAARAERLVFVHHTVDAGQERPSPTTDLVVTDVDAIVTAGTIRRTSATEVV